jgi:hypothetical protein
MAVYINKSGGRLVLPDGSQVEDRAECTVVDTGNLGVSIWINAGWLEPVTVAPPKPVENSGKK